jgi:hypothetical protein
MWMVGEGFGVTLLRGGSMAKSNFVRVDRYFY